MSLCCCGNLKLRLGRSKSNSASVKSTAGDTRETVDENKSTMKPNDKHQSEANCSDRKPSLPIEKQSVDSSTNDEPTVVLRSEPARQKIARNQSDNNNNVSLHPSRSSSLLKSIFHKSIRFDEENMDYNSNCAAVKRQNSRFQKPFVATSRRGSLYIFRNADDVIITPFAQILSSLRKVRANFMLITNISSSSDKR